ncbi:50S ribosomal protein L10 [Candidatus Berkelbacteria bacterium]|nr:50S ribosomal protein L10 [Candidatus Berkelbacteria bacterium]
MAITRVRKEEQLALLTAMLQEKAIVFTRYSGLTVRDLDELRRALRAVKSRYLVTKNTLLRKAMEQANLTIPSEIFDIQLGIAVSADDEVEPNRVVVTFAKTHEAFGILGAIVDGKFIDTTNVKSLAALPSRDQLYAKVAGSLAAPLAGLMNVLSGNLRGLVNVLHQYQTKLSTNK